MKKIWNWIKNNPNRSMFLIPIILVAGISMSHVVTWYDMANPHNWAIYLSIAIEIGAMTALVAATNKIKGGVWFMFGLVTMIQMIGNIFYSYVQIDETGSLFKNWVELTGPVWELIGTETTDVIGLKRWLAFLEGGLLPLISLTSLHFFVKYEKEDEEPSVSKSPPIKMSVPEGKEFNRSYTLPLTEKEVVVEESDDTPTDDMVNQVIEDQQTIGDLIESLEYIPDEESKIIDIVNEQAELKKKTVNNPPPKKRMGIERIQ